MWPLNQLEHNIIHLSKLKTDSVPSIIRPLLVETSTICMPLSKNQRSNPRKILFFGKLKITSRVDLNLWEPRCAHLVQTQLEDRSVQLMPKSEELSMLPVKTQLLVEMSAMTDQFLLIKKSEIKVTNIIKLSKFSKLRNLTWKHKVLLWHKSSSQMLSIWKELLTQPKIGSSWMKKTSLDKTRITINL